MLASRLRVLAGDRGTTIAELADELFTPVIDRAWGLMLKRMDDKG